MVLFEVLHLDVWCRRRKGSQKHHPVTVFDGNANLVRRTFFTLLSFHNGQVEELAVIVQTFSNQITGLTNHLSDATNSIGSISSSLIVLSYSGDPKEFQNWIKTLEKQALLDTLSDDGIKRLTFRSSREASSDFIQCFFLHDNPQENWASLKQELTARFCDVPDQMHTFILFILFVR